MIKSANKSIFLKISIFVLSLMLLSSCGYIYYQFVEKNVAKKYVEVEKKMLIADLLSCKKEIDSLLLKNDSLNQELISERKKIVLLLAQIKNDTFDSNAVLFYKNNVNRLNKTIASIISEKNQLIKTNTNLQKQRDSTIRKLGSAAKYGDSVVRFNEHLQSKLKKEYSKISAVKLQAVAYKQKSSGEKIVVSSARKTDLININFLVLGNSAKGKEAVKEYYIQIIDPINNVMGENRKLEFDNQILFYSTATSVTIDSKGQDANFDLFVKKPLKGTYKINVFDKNNMVLSTTLELN